MLISLDLFNTIYINWKVQYTSRPSPFFVIIWDTNVKLNIFLGYSKPIHVFIFDHLCGSTCNQEDNITENKWTKYLDDLLVFQTFSAVNKVYFYCLNQIWIILIFLIWVQIMNQLWWFLSITKSLYIFKKWGQQFLPWLVVRFQIFYVNYNRFTVIIIAVTMLQWQRTSCNI